MLRACLYQGLSRLQFTFGTLVVALDLFLVEYVEHAFVVALIEHLDGGTLALADSTTNSFAALKLSQSSAIQLGENANLSFADTSAESWSDGVRLAITVPDLLNFAIRFGDSASALTPAQISRIRLNRMSVVLDESGYLRVRDGLKIIVR